MSQSHVDSNEIQKHINRIEAREEIEKILSDIENSDDEDTAHPYPELIRASATYPDVQHHFETIFEDVKIHKFIPLGNKTNFSVIESIRNGLAKIST